MSHVVVTAKRRATVKVSQKDTGRELVVNAVRQSCLWTVKVLRIKFLARGVVMAPPFLNRLTAM